MANYENISTSEVQKLARQGNKDALHEMVWRLELMPQEHRNDPVESCAWQDYWLEKAADAGNVDAKFRFAQSLIRRVMNAEDRQKAMKCFQSLVNDFDAGKLISEDDRECGIIAKLWLGVMLCEGYHTQRDAVKGAKLIKEADALTKGFDSFGFKVMKTLGEVFGQGCAQSGGEPSIDDLEQAIKYQETAIVRFNAERDDPNNRGYLELAKNYLEILKKRKDSKESLKRFTGNESTYNPNFVEWQKEMMGISPAAQDRVKADKVALARLRQRLAQEGW